MGLDRPGTVWTNADRILAAEWLADHFRPMREVVRRLVRGEPADPVVIASLSETLSERLVAFDPRLQSWLSFVWEALTRDVDDYLRAERQLRFRFLNDRQILHTQVGPCCPREIFYRLAPADRAMIRHRVLGREVADIARLYDATERAVLDAFGNLQQLWQPVVAPRREVQPADALGATLHLRLFEQSAVYGLALGVSEEASAEVLGLHPAIFNQYLVDGLARLDALAQKGGAA
jgi:hypothetical protein